MATLHGKGKDWHCGRLEIRDYSAHHDTVQERLDPSTLLPNAAGALPATADPRADYFPIKDIGAQEWPVGPTTPKQGEQNERKTRYRQFGTDLRSCLRLILRNKV